MSKAWMLGLVCMTGALCMTAIACGTENGEAGHGDHDPSASASPDSGTASIPASGVGATIVLGNVGAQAYVVNGVEPAEKRDALIGDGDQNQTLQLTVGRRYAIQNLATSGHPLDLIQRGASPGADVKLLTQDGAGELEGDPSIDWVESGQTITFTLSESLAARLDGYRCSFHPGSMRGAIEISR